MIVGELSCFLTYFVQTFAGLVVTRAITGFSIGGSLPIVYSVLGDIYAAEGRNAVSGLIATSVGIGLGVGQGIAGYLGPTFGWRFPFLVVSVPSFLVSIFAFSLPEPARGAKERAILEYNQQKVPPSEGEDMNETEVNSRTKCDIEDGGTWTVPQTETSPHLVESRYVTEHPSWKNTWKMLCTPTVILVILQGAPNVIPFGIISVYLNDFLSQNKGLTIEVK